MDWCWMRGDVLTVRRVWVTVYVTFTFLLLASVSVHSSHAQAPVKSTDSKQTTVSKEEIPEAPSETADSESKFAIECDDDDKQCKRDQDGLEAIRALHRLIDDDQNGNVDQLESDEFMRDELQYTDGFERQSIFHGNDTLISVGDLWRAWTRSQVYNWTGDDVIEWLVNHVELPQYVRSFEENEVDGRTLPRLATNSQLSYISQKLGIKNPVHKQRIILKSMDLILFGPPKPHNYLKDLALVASLVIALGGCWLAYVQHKYSQFHLKKMMKDLDSLQQAENTLQDLQEKLQRAEQDQMTVVEEKQNLEKIYMNEIEVAKAEAERLKQAREDCSPEEVARLKYAEEELVQVRAALRKAEKEMERSQWSAPASMQAWLQLTHEIEIQHFSVKKQAAERQFASAREGCEKVKRKRQAFLGSLRMAHSNSIDDIDQKILQARSALEEIRQDLQERIQRWSIIEQLCGFPIMSNPGLSSLKQMLQPNLPGGSSSRTVSTSLVPPLNVEDGDDDDLPPAYAAATGYAQPGPSIVKGDLKRRPQSLNRQAQGRLSHSSSAESSDGGVGSPSSVSFHLGESSPGSPESPTIPEENEEQESPELPVRGVVINVPKQSSLLPVATPLLKSHSFAPPPKNSTIPPEQAVVPSQNGSGLKGLQKRSQSEANVTTLSATKRHSLEEGNHSSGTESADCDDRRSSSKRKIKLIPKFMRKDHEKHKESSKPKSA